MLSIVTSRRDTPADEARPCLNPSVKLARNVGSSKALMSRAKNKIVDATVGTTTTGGGGENGYGDCERGCERGCNAGGDRGGEGTTGGGTLGNEGGIGAKGIGWEGKEGGDGDGDRGKGGNGGGEGI